MEKRNRLWLLAGIAVVLSIYFFFFGQKGIWLHGEFLQKQRAGSVMEFQDGQQTGLSVGLPVKKQGQQASVKTAVYQGEIQGSEAVVQISHLDEGSCCIYFSIGDIRKEYRLELEKGEEWLQDIVIYQDGAVLFDGKYNPDRQEQIFKLYQDDGMPSMEDMITITFNGQEEKVEGLDLYQLASLYAGAETIRGNVTYAAGGILLLMFWLVDLLFPRFFFLLSHSLSVNNPEPSEFYLITQQISWVLYPVIVAVMLLMGLFVQG